MEKTEEIENMEKINKLERIDKLLAQEYNISRQEAVFLIETEKILLGKRKITKTHSKLSLEDFNKINLKKEEALSLLKQKEADEITKKNEKTNIKSKTKEEEKDLKNIELEILYEDKDILIVNKPKGLVVYSGVGKEDISIVSILKDKYNLSNLYGEERAGIVHRLDKDTSGLLLVAKNNKSHKYYEALFKKREIEKEYIALVRGNIQENKGKIDMPILRSRSDFKKMEANLKGREAITYFTVLERFKNYTLVSINIETGRTHQIRVHFSQIGYPIVGDKKYSKGKNDFNINSQLLHAISLKFLDVDDNIKDIKSKIPKEFEDILKILRNESKI